MKLVATVSKIEVIRMPFGKQHIEVTCTTLFGPDSFSFRVEDDDVARRTYYIGREVEAELTPRRES